jgi:hypothetical protein
MSIADEAQALSRLERRLPPLLSVIAGMVDLTSFLTLGNIFAAHITGNLVVIAAVLVRGGPLKLEQALAIPAFMPSPSPGSLPMHQGDAVRALQTCCCEFTFCCWPACCFSVNWLYMNNVIEVRHEVAYRSCSPFSPYRRREPPVSPGESRGLNQERL